MTVSFDALILESHMLILDSSLSQEFRGAMGLNMMSPVDLLIGRNAFELFNS